MIPFWDKTWRHAPQVPVHPLSISYESLNPVGFIITRYRRHLGPGQVQRFAAASYQKYTEHTLRRERTEDTETACGILVLCSSKKWSTVRRRALGLINPHISFSEALAALHRMSLSKLVRQLGQNDIVCGQRLIIQSVIHLTSPPQKPCF